MRKEIVVAGFGGQGVILMGTIMCTAAGLYEDREVAQVQSYGPASRGGACRTEVTLSSDVLDYPRVTRPDVMVLMSPMAAEKYLGEADPETTSVLIDSSLVSDVSYNEDNLYLVPATDMAERDHNNRIVANTLMLGALSAITGLISVEAIEQALDGRVPPRALDLNIRALKAGYEYGRELAGGGGK